METREPSAQTIRDLHHDAGASAYRALDSAGVYVNPVIGGLTRRISLSSGLTISAASFLNPIAFGETVCPAGRQISLFLRGGPCALSVEGAQTCRVAPGAGLLCASPDSYQTRVAVEAGESYCFVSIGFKDAWAEDIVRHPSAADDPLLRLLDCGADRAFCGDFPLSRSVRQLAQTYFSSQISGACGVLIAEARALEIIVAIAEAMASAAGKPRSVGLQPKLTPADIERLAEAKRLIDAEPETAFTLPILARRVGVNVNKLKAGFKLLFGRTVGEHAKQVRMAHAYHLLVEEGLQVASVAYRLGYTPTHFAIAFRRSYGVPPSRVVR